MPDLIVIAESFMTYNLKKLIQTLVFACIILTGSLWSMSSSFHVSKIEFKGLQKVSVSTAMHYMPVRAGGRVTDENSIKIIQDLYKTGFFKDVQINHVGSTLVIIVQERPTIGMITFAGNTTVTNKMLLKVLHTNDIEEGAFYNAAKLHQIIAGLKQLYEQTGHNDAIVDVKATKGSENRVALHININEGGVAKVKSITVVGAPQFSNSTLVNQMPMHPVMFFNFFSSADKFSQGGVNNDIQALTNYFLDHGYLDFQVVNQEVHMSDDNKHVRIVFHVNTGDPYTVSTITINNHTKRPLSEITKQVSIHSGDVFSRSQVQDMIKSISDLFVNDGYAFPQVQLIPQINPKLHTVAIKIDVAEGKRYYVRYITFTGNHATNDTALRHFTTFSEQSVYSKKQIDETKRNFQANMPFIATVNPQVKPVLGSKDELDVNYALTEASATQAQISGGYSTTDGILYGLSFTDPNFRGQAKSVSIALQRSQLADSINIGYSNPYYTINNVSRSFNLYFNRTHSSSNLNYASYNLNSFGGSVNYSVPVSQNLYFSYGLGYDQQAIKKTSSTSDVALNFMKKYGHKFYNVKVMTGAGYNDTDRYYFATSGVKSNLNVTLGTPAFKNSLSYYSASFKTNVYIPLSHSHRWVAILHTSDSYGSGYGTTKEFPFINNYYGGGIGSLPGFDANSLGPKDKDGNAIGGNILVAYGLDVVFPTPMKDSLRAALTFNGANVYNRYLTQSDVAGGTLSSGPIRYSAGLQVSVRLPAIGIISFASAKAINPKPGDNTTWFNFTFGTTF